MAFVVLSVFICTNLCKFLRSKGPDYMLQNFLISCSETIHFLPVELSERKAASVKNSCCLLGSPQMQMMSISFFSSRICVFMSLGKYVSKLVQLTCIIGLYHWRKS